MLCCDSGFQNRANHRLCSNPGFADARPPVCWVRDLLHDPHLRERDFFESLKHHPESGIGERRTIGRPWKLSGTDLAITRPAPQLGEHNRELLTTLLECSDAEVDAMEKSQVIGNTIAGSPVIAALHLDGMRKNSRIGKMDDEYREV